MIPTWNALANPKRRYSPAESVGWVKELAKKPMSELRRMQRIAEVNQQGVDRHVPASPDDMTNNNTPRNIVSHNMDLMWRAVTAAIQKKAFGKRTEKAKKKSIKAAPSDVESYAEAALPVLGRIRAYADQAENQYMNKVRELQDNRSYTLSQYYTKLGSYLRQAEFHLNRARFAAQQGGVNTQELVSAEGSIGNAWGYAGLLSKDRETALPQFSQWNSLLHTMFNKMRMLRMSKSSKAVKAKINHKRWTVGKHTIQTWYDKDHVDPIDRKYSDNPPKMPYVLQIDNGLTQQWKTEGERTAYLNFMLKMPRFHEKSVSPTKNKSLFDTIRAGDRVTIMTPQGQRVSGRAVIHGPAGWVLNTGGQYGRTALADARNTVKVTAGRGGHVGFDFRRSVSRKAPSQTDDQFKVKVAIQRWLKDIYALHDMVEAVRHQPKWNRTGMEGKLNDISNKLAEAAGYGRAVWSNLNKGGAPDRMQIRRYWNEAYASASRASNIAGGMQTVGLKPTYRKPLEQLQTALFNRGRTSSALYLAQMISTTQEWKSVKAVEFKVNDIVAVPPGTAALDGALGYGGFNARVVAVIGNRLKVRTEHGIVGPRTFVVPANRVRLIRRLGS